MVVTTGPQGLSWVWSPVSLCFGSLNPDIELRESCLQAARQQFEELGSIILIFPCLTHFSPPSVSSVPGTREECNKNLLNGCGVS